MHRATEANVFCICTGSAPLEIGNGRDIIENFFLLRLTVKLQLVYENARFDRFDFSQEISDLKMNLSNNATQPETNITEKEVKKLFSPLLAK